MSAKRLAILVAPILLLVSGACAQDFNESYVNEASVTVGRTFVSTQTVTNPPPGDLDPRIHFGNPISFGFNYGRLLKAHKIFGLYGELPVAYVPTQNLNTYANNIPKDYGAFFITPSARLNFFYGQGVSPWVSVGAGYARFDQSSSLIFGGANQGASSTNTYAIQFGTGLDVWFWRHWGLRLEARDFYTGKPDLSAVPSSPVSTSNGQQHNYYVGVGVAHRF
jgi:hypothetical protein